MQLQKSLLGQCKAQPFNFVRVSLFLSFFLSVPQHNLVLVNFANPGWLVNGKSALAPHDQVSSETFMGPWQMVYL